MDRITAKNPGKATRCIVIVLVILLSAGIMTYKAFDNGWLMSREPLDLSNAPVLLFFNRHKGCECEMVVYTAAENQIANWSDENRQSILIVRIDLDRRPDLGKQINIIRAPALLLVDTDGNVLFGQKESISDTAPLDLDAFTAAIDKVKNGK